MKKVLGLVLAVSMILTGCGVQEAPQPEITKKQYTATFLNLFDTVTAIVGKAETEEEFTGTAQKVHDELLVYNQYFDIYKEYEGIANLKTINDNAGIAPVKVDEPIIQLLLDCKEAYEFTDGKVNVAMGSVLSLWHNERSYGRNNPADASLPQEEKLLEAAKHIDFDAVIIDEEASTVYIEDPEMSLDVGAIAKGWSVQRVAENSPSGLLISVGGNVCATGPKDETGTPWVVGIQDPDNSENYLHTIYVTKECVVTSGDYQRTYVVDGVAYHHIIDPDTLYPSKYFRSVTIVCEDSGIADALSTALFLMPLDEGKELLEQFEAEAIWVDFNGEIYYSEGFRDLIRT